MATLSNIRSKVRKITARDSTQLTDSELDDYVNNYYRYDLPAELRILKLQDYYTFTTQPNIDAYAFDSENYSFVEPTVRIGGFDSIFTTDPGSFYDMRPRIPYNAQVATGDGTAGPYTGTIESVPFYRSFNTYANNGTFPTNYPLGQNPEVVFSAEVNDSQMLIANDTPNVTGSGTSAKYTNSGSFVGEVATQASGSINYITGAFSITFSSAVPSGNPIYAQVTNYAASRPRYVLFYQNQFIVSPVPDGAYTVELAAYRTPAALANSSDSPELKEMWQLLAVGAALKIFEDNGDLEQYSAYLPVLRRYESMVRSRSNLQSTRNRAPTIYSMPLGNGDSGVPYYQGY